MFRQIVKSTIDKGRLRFVETSRDDQSIPIGPEGKKFLHRLLQADPFKHEKVKTADNGIKPSSKKVVQEHNDNIFEGENSIEATMKTPRTGGQQENPKVDASKIKESKGRGKHKSKKAKSHFRAAIGKIQEDE